MAADFLTKGCPSANSTRAYTYATRQTPGPTPPPECTSPRLPLLRLLLLRCVDADAYATQTAALASRIGAGGVAGKVDLAN
eukprot:scaffold216864_cov26-Tisochrysis_lutea.AAC.1